MKRTRMRGFPWIVLLAVGSVAAEEVHVSPTGDDGNSGTADRPLRTFAAAQQAARKMKAQTVLFHAGTYYLPETVVITPEDSGTTYAAAPGESVVVSGGSKLDLKWQPHRDGIVQARTPAGLAIDQLFVNGQRQHMARYPNFDPDARPYNGYAADAFSPQRAARWADPAGGYIHAMHRAHWGGYHYRITGKNAERRGHLRRRLAEQPPDGHAPAAPLRGEHLRGTRRARRMVPQRADRRRSTSTRPQTSTSARRPSKSSACGTWSSSRAAGRKWTGTESDRSSSRSILCAGFIFRHAARTFMDAKEPLLRSDWTIYRGGAVLFNGAEDCTVADCEFDQLGGNAVFVNNYNRRIRITGCDIHDTGASAVAFVGDPAGRAQSAVRVQPAPELRRDRQDARPADQDRQLPGRLHRRGLPAPALRRGREAGHRRADLHVAGHHHPALLDLRGLARRHQHQRRHLRRPPHRVLRRVRHGARDRRPRQLQFLGPRSLLGPEGRAGRRAAAAGAAGRGQADRAPQQPLALRSRLGRGPRRRLVELRDLQQPVPARRPEAPRRLPSPRLEQHCRQQHAPSARLVRQQRRRGDEQHLDGRLPPGRRHAQREMGQRRSTATCSPPPTPTARRSPPTAATPTRWSATRCSSIRPAATIASRTVRPP